MHQPTAPTAIVTRRQANLRRLAADDPLRRETSLFYAFKAGDLAAAEPYARRLAAALSPRAPFAGIIPVPLSPDRAAAGHPHRTLSIARRLAAHTAAPVLDLLRLAAPITKHNDLPRDPDPTQLAAWTARYRTALRLAAPVPAGPLVLVDDAVCRGTTLSACRGFLLSAHPRATIHTAAAVRFLPPPLTPPSSGYNPAAGPARPLPPQGQPAMHRPPPADTAPPRR